MNKKTIALLLVIATILISYRSYNDSRQSLEVYLASGDSDDIKSLVLSSKPVLTDRDIVSYIWDTHEIALSRVYLGSVHTKSPDQNSGKLPDSFYGGSKLLGASYKDKFVIVVNGEKVYWGRFPKPAHFSSINTGPVIVDIQGGIAIKFFPNGPNTIDARNDTRIYDVLKSKGLIKH